MRQVVISSICRICFYFSSLKYWFPMIAICTVFFLNSKFAEMSSFFIHQSYFFRSISVIFNASLPFFIHSFRLSIFDQFCAGLPASKSVTLLAEYLLHFSFSSILPVFVLDLDLVIGVCIYLGSPMLKIYVLGQPWSRTSCFLWLVRPVWMMVGCHFC